VAGLGGAQLEEGAQVAGLDDPGAAASDLADAQVTDVSGAPEGAGVHPKDAGSLLERHHLGQRADCGSLRAHETQSC